MAKMGVARAAGEEISNVQQEAFEKLLAANLARTIDFVRFSETKNAALLTFSSAWILTSINILNGNSTLAVDWKAALNVALPLFIVAALISILSFFPRTNLSSFHRNPERAKALLYFGDAASFSPESYRDRLKERYMPPANRCANQNYLDDLSVQINVNSSIAVRKFAFFKCAAIVALMGIAALLVPAILHLIHLICSTIYLAK